MATWGASHRSILLGILFQCAVIAPLAVDADTQVTRPATLQASIDLRTLALSAGEDTLACFEGSQAVLVNPGCFATSNPTQSGDCAATESHFFVQYLFPQPPDLRRLRGFGFYSNDDSTVFPSAGALLLPIVDGNVAFPTAAELANLQRTNIDSPADTSQVFVDLSSEEILVGPGNDVAVVLVLQFPAGQLVQQTQGPGIAAESSDPDADCDFFTIDGGASGTWFAPYYDPGTPGSLPLDWGFVAVFDPLSTAVERVTWSSLKQYYRTP